MENSTDSAFIDLVIAGMLLAFVLATAIILFVLFYQRKVNAQRQKLQLVQIEHQKAMIHATLQAVEEERRQFASNLHDEIGAQLSIAKIILSSDGNIQDENSGTINSTIEILNETIESVQNISHNLFPPVLAKLGLEKAIESYLRKIPDSTIEIKFQSNLHSKRFDRNTELHAFRIFQESLSNALKHSRGSEIAIELRPHGNQFSIEINDNGKGFTTNSERIGLGLQGMMSRAEMIHFELNVISKEPGITVLLTPKTT